MDDPVGVQVLKGRNQVSKVELGPLVIEGAHLLEQSVEISSLHILHDHVEVLAALEGVDAADDKVVVDAIEDVPLVHHKVLHVLLHHDCLVEHFYRKDVIRLFLPGEDNLSVGSSRDCL